MPPDAQPGSPFRPFAMPVRQRSGSCGCQAVRKAKNYDRAPCAGPDDCADLPGRPPRPSAVRPVPHWSHIAHAQAAARKRTDSHGRGLVPACRPFGRSGGQEVKWSGDREVRRSEGREIRRSRGQVAKRSEGRKIRRSGYGESQKAGRTSFRTAPVSPPAQHSATSETLQACASSCDSQTPGTLPGTASAKSPHRKRLERKRRRPEYEKRRIVRKMPFRRTNAGRGGPPRTFSAPVNEQAPRRPLRTSGCRDRTCRAHRTHRGALVHPGASCARNEKAEKFSGRF